MAAYNHCPHNLKPNKSHKTRLQVAEALTDLKCQHQSFVTSLVDLLVLELVLAMPALRYVHQVKD